MAIKVRPTVVVGIGEWGTRVVTAFAGRVERRAGQVPVVRAVTLGPGIETGWSTTLTADLEQVRHLDAVQTTRRAGIEVETRVGSAVVLAASLDEEGTVSMVSEVACWLRQRSERDLTHGLTLSAVLLLPRPGSTPAQADVGIEPGPEFGRSDPLTAVSRAIVTPHLFDEGCYLLDQVNADGLLLADGEKQARAVANCLTLWVMTPLQEVLDRKPPGGTERRYDTFGVAAWEFPLDALVDHLAHRWQQDVLDALLAPAPDDRGTVRLFLEQRGQVPPWPQDTALRFRVSGGFWSSPSLDLVHDLSQEIEQAVEEEQTRLRDLAVQSAGSLDPVCGETASALTAKVDHLLDGPGLGVAEQFLAELEKDARTRATRADREAERCYARVDELDEPAGEARQTLNDLITRFPPLQLRVLLGLILRPWRLLPAWLLYRQIGRQASVYVAYRESQSMLQIEACERKWEAAFYTRLVQMVGDERESLAQLQSQLERSRESLANDTSGLDPSLARDLEAAALPVEIVDHFYRRAAGGEASLFALYGPLSRWARDGYDSQTLDMILAEHAREQFAFLERVRLDELLAHTHSGAALRRRLRTLIETSAPWWTYDEAAFGPDDRAQLSRRVLIGLPDADDSLLVDLLPDRPFSCFSTRDRRQVVVIQVIQGFQIGEQRLENGE